jgi:hypothetical protein
MTVPDLTRSSLLRTAVLIAGIVGVGVLCLTPLDLGIAVSLDGSSTGSATTPPPALSLSRPSPAATTQRIDHGRTGLLDPQ